jgi:hypothetical protein
MEAEMVKEDSEILMQGLGNCNAFEGLGFEG